MVNYIYQLMKRFVNNEKSKGPDEKKERRELMKRGGKGSAGAATMAVHQKPLKKRILDNWQLYAMLLIPVILTIIYKYIPMYGIQIAFRDYKASRGMWGSEWVGLKWFERFFTAPNCARMIRNTVLLSLYSLLWSFPIPVILALMINQLRFPRFKRVTQTVLYAPHFISTMVICGMIRIFLSPSGGLLNLLLGTSIDFLTESSAFRTIYIASGIWQDAGWGIIVYMATLATVDAAQYEAAKIDGASMFQRILNIDIPALTPIMVLQLIMSVGGLMNVGFEKVWLLQTDLNKATSDVIAVYVYQQGIENAKYSYSTAVGLFNTAVNIVLLILVNKVAKRISEDTSFV
jgi:putative aldouronate transport system permease protein